MIRYIVIFLLFFLLSCQEEKITFPLKDRSNSFSIKDKQALLPNALFEALLDRKSNEVLQNIINENGHYLFALNSYGDSALSLAIQFHNPKGALFITEQLSPKHYLHTNSKGEGYIYLLSQKGYVNVIQLLSKQFYLSKKNLFSDYEFSDLDMITHSGERALHVAKNQSIAEALAYEYRRGSLEHPLRKFQYFQNNQGQSFFHTAVRDQNSNLLRWGLEQNCVERKDWKAKPFYYKYPILLWRGLQTYGKPFGLDWDDLLNTQDHLGRTAINFSAETLFLEGIHILSKCQWTDYFFPDNKENIPLQNFLLALDALQIDHEEEIRKTFTLLMESQTRLTWHGLSDHINFLNKQGESSLHIAARMADPFFYTQLKKYGIIEAKNKEGQTPKEIFKLKRQQLKTQF